MQGLQCQRGGSCCSLCMFMLCDPKAKDDRHAELNNSFMVDKRRCGQTSEPYQKLQQLGQTRSTCFGLQWCMHACAHSLNAGREDGDRPRQCAVGIS